MPVQIVLNQAGAPPGVVGVAREDLVTSVPVVAQAVGGPFISYKWNFISKSPNVIAGTDSSAAFSAPTASSTNVTPIDNPGTYLIEVVVDSGQGPGATVDDVARMTFYAALVGDPVQGVLNPDPTLLPRRWPAFGERREHNVPDAISPLGNPTGWAREMLRWFAYFRTLTGGGGGGGANLPAVAVTTTGTSTPNTVEAVGVRVAAISRTLAGSTGDTVEIVDEAELAGTWVINVLPGAGTTFVNPEVGANCILQTDGETAKFRKVSATRWARMS